VTQAIVAPCDLGRDKRLHALSAVIASPTILGFFNLSARAFNLLAIRPLDGAISWGLLPGFRKPLRAKPARRKPGWPSWR
jgi:Zn-dependent protease